MLLKGLSIIIAVIFIVNYFKVETTAVDVKSYIQCSILTEIETGTVVSQNNGRVKVPIGMLNKLMTINVVYDSIENEEIALSDEVSVSLNANTKQGAQIWLMPGEKITIGDAVKSVIIGNANDAAAVLAESVSGTEERFVEVMNSKADSLGMNDTLFTNPDGYYDSNKQISTAYDLSVLVCEMARNNIFTDYFTQKMDYVRNGEAMLVNSNKLVNKYDGLVGYKFCYSEETGYCLAAAAVRNEESYSVVLLGYENEDELYNEAVRLLDKGFSQYSILKPEIPTDCPAEITVKNGEKTSAALEYSETEKIVMKNADAQKIDTYIALPEYIEAPIDRGDKIGEVQFYKNEEYIYSVNILAKESINKISTKSNVVKMLKFLICF